MKVLKFGGTSVGSVQSILSLKNIVENEARKQPLVVVVSALGGVTDRLLLTSRLALQGNDAWKAEFEAIVERHHEMVDAIITNELERKILSKEIDSLLEQLRSIYFGVFLIRDLSEKTQNAIVSYGERISSRIVATLIRGSRWFDSREFIKTVFKNGHHVLHASLTAKLVKETFSELPRISLVPGFISADRDTAETTNLGRGGSDYTAAIIAAALDAEVLEIWTDVDGFMTADPRVIQTAYTIQELSYIEATELCNFGAKVVYPPTIYPVCVKNIPIKVKNTFNPSAAGTIIKSPTPTLPDREGEVKIPLQAKKLSKNSLPIGEGRGGAVIKGLSSIKGTALVTVTGLSMVGVIGVNRRIFTALANNGISVFMVSQASSENSTSIGVREEDADAAAEVLNEEFQKEIHTGAMYEMRVVKGLATIAIVGENMKQTPGIAGKLFGTLGRSGISVIAFAQGASQTNISFVVESRFLRKALNVLHDSFFLSEYKVLNIFICGTGTVGGKLIEQIRQQYEVLKENNRLKLNVVGISSSKKAIYSRDGLCLDNYRQQLDAAEDSNVEKLAENIISMNIFNSVFVDCTASDEIAALYQRLLDHNISVVAANKIAASGDFEVYSHLKHTALTRGVKYLFETNVGAGLPIISTINDLINSGDRILKIEAVLSGTLNFIFNKLTADNPFSATVLQAKEAGYAEPDPRIDLSGKDVMRKLIILTREAGYRAEIADVDAQLFVPDEYFQGSVEDFWRRLPELDPHFEAQRQQLEAEGKRLRFVARMEQGRCSVELEAVEKSHPFYNLEGSNNIIILTTERYHEYPLLIQGYGAGASVTAAGVFANIMSIANV